VTFDSVAAKALYAALESQAKALAVFDEVNTAAPVKPPETKQNGVSLTIELGPWVPVPSSGLAMTSGKITFVYQLWSSLMQRPQSGIDPQVLGALAAVVAALSDGFTLGGLVRNVDLFGMSAEPGYVPDFEGKPFRVIRLDVPVILNDMFEQEA
jgi:hypothetical protein